MDYPEIAARDTFSQGPDRWLVLHGFGFWGAPQKALLLVFPTTPTPSTSFNLLPSYPILNPASWMEIPENHSSGTFIEGARPLSRVGFG